MSNYPRMYLVGPSPQINIVSWVAPAAGHIGLWADCGHWCVYLGRHTCCVCTGETFRPNPIVCAVCRRRKEDTHVATP